MHTLIGDLRFALRQLRKSPGFTAVAVLTLALGIGANTAIFTVVNGVLLRPLPYRDPGQLVTVEHRYPSLHDLHASVSVPGFRDYHAQTGVLAHSAVETNWNPNLTGRGEPERLSGARVSGEFFTTLGVAPARGRAIAPDEAERAAARVVVLSDGLWRRALGGSSQAVGSTLQLDGESYEVVGVMPPEFRDPASRNVELWTPIAFRPDQFADGQRTTEFLFFLGRLAPGQTEHSAQSAFTTLAEQLKHQFTDAYAPDWGLLVTPLSVRWSGNARTALLVLLGAVAFVLVIACANVANLELSRAAARSREIAVRIALGASAPRLIRQLLTESVLLSVVGGAVGLLLALWGVPALVAFNRDILARPEAIRLDGRVLLFTAGLSLLTGLIFGLAPAGQLLRTGVHDTLKEGGRGASADRAGLAVRRGLVVASVALALTLLAGAGLLLRSFARLQGVDPGFRPDHLLTFSVTLPQAKYPSDTQQVALFERLIPAIAAVPGAASVGGTSDMPFSGSWSTASFDVEGYQVPKGGNMPWGDIRTVTPEFLRTLGVRLLAGRQFLTQDGPGSLPVAIVDDELAKRYWPRGTALGKRITYDGAANPKARWLEIVGVVEHSSQEGLDGERRTQVYVPLAQAGRPNLDIAVRTRGEPQAALAAVRAAVHDVDADLPLSRVRSMDDLMEATTGPRRVSMILLGIVAAVALALAAIGLYGVMSYSVSQRSRELGIRIALGAHVADILRMVVRQGLGLALAGVGLGLVAALGMTRLIKSMLFGVPATDVVTFGGMVLLLVAVAFVACWLPARRATRVDPVVALRTE